MLTNLLKRDVVAVCLICRDVVKVVCLVMTTME